GNPGHAGLFEFFRTLLGGSAGMAKETKQAINKAYERGVIIVCAAGQIIEAIVEPALFPRTIAVGGFDKRGGDIAHYPTEGYNLPQRIDIWAQAQRVNRAAYNLNASPPQEIYADEMDTGDPSGTSYACPQVAASAALWVATHQATLETSTFADTPWRKVEAFRNALKRTATHMPARLPFNKTTPIRMLEIERLLGFAPEVPADSDKKPAS
ncbi:MAG: S8/S53 family peptidase, partial [Pseudomonadota bacterium]